MTKANNKNSTAKQVQLESDEQLISRMQEIPIAIVGMSSIFANAKNLDQYWDNILESVDCIMDVPPSRWNIDDYYDEDKRAADKVYCKRGGFIPDIDFNPMEYGLPPNILEITDVAQLLSLVVAKDVLEDAGLGEDSGKSRERVGITLGVGGGQKLIAPLTSRLQGPVLDRVLKSSGVPDKDRNIIIEKFKSAYVPWEENSFPGMLGNVIAGRVANRFDLGGMNCVVDAACAGSLAAIKMAVSDLLEGRSDAMITGGVCCDNSPFMYMSFSKTPAFTTNQTIQPFDHDSKGMMVGEGLGMVVLKRLADAERDGDRIYAQIKGVGTSSDGRFKSIYAPRPEGQELALKRAYADAGIDMRTVGIVEAHGTGTAAGDLAEFNGLRSAFSKNNDKKNHIALGSVKSQIGHAKSAAGAAGFIKMALALHHKVLPGTINVEKPNPALNVDDSPFYINSETRPWMPREDGAPRVAGVSSFGFGGTNFHFVLQEYTAHQDGKFRVNQAPQAVILTGADVKAVKANCSAWLDKVSGDDGEVQQQQLTMNNGFRPIPVEQARLGFVSKSAEETKSLLEKAIATLDKKAADAAWELPMGVFYRSSGMDASGKVVALFSGQGSQYVNMLRELAPNFPPVMNAIEDLDKLYSAEGKSLLSKCIYPNPVFDKADAKVQETELQKTQNAQPSIGVVGVGLFKLMQNAGLKASYTAGHSFGELTALWAAGVLNEADYFALAKARGEAMAAPDDANFDAGTMVAVVGDPDKVAADISGNSDVTIANYNSNNQVVIAGATDAVNKAFDDLKAKGYKVVKLPVSAAFHTPLVGHAQAPFAAAISKAVFNSPSIPVYANGTGLPHSNNADEIKAVMKNHILESVRFKDEVENIYNDGGRIFVEFGPKNVLSKLVGNILADKDYVAVALNGNPKKSSDLQFRQAAVQLAVAGVELGTVDPYEIDRTDLSTIKKSPMNVKLNAGLYMSDKTRKAHEEKLNDGHKIEGVAVSAPAPAPVAAPTPAPATTAADAKSLAILESIEKSIEQFNVRQSETLDVHQKFMEGPKQYTETFQNLLQQQTALLQSSGSLPESLERSMMMFHEFQGETLRVHESYLNSQMSELNRVVEGVTEQYRALATGNVVAKKIVPAAALQATTPAPVAPAVVAAVSVPVPVVPAVDVAKIHKVMMDVVAEKTGYPAEMLELSMDMEADLGIDSIKRVEILGAVQDELPDLPELNPDDLAELRTLGQIVDYMNAKAGASTPAVAPAAVAAAPVADAPAVDVAKINKVMMDVVAEKTGYPAEMLELSMDMEADLGIDSIKRVEILGAVQDELPDLPELNPDDLAELRTLGQIVDYMNAKAGASTPAVAPVAVAAAPVADAPVVDVAKIHKVMMDVVAEKTGYPAEMLELSMDMEADLGIDSIKRVEILGAVQDELPDLPDLNPDDLAELRTLGQIVDYMNKKAGASAAVAPVAQVVAPAPAAALVATPSIDVEKINSVMMNVVAEKTGYPAEMLELGMDMEADLGIDSIKRVEILGAVQDELPDLPELNPDDLAELRTLGQIVDYMNAKAGASTPAVAPVAAAPVADAPAVDVAKIHKVMMDVVAEKTGYPAEMLELSMDMEADLGIDSIKRVEILGAVQDELPDLPELNPDDLAELRTLGQIVDYMNEKAGASAVVVPVAQVVTPAPAAAPTATPSIDVEKINKVMMDVVAEKTGYPAEMLELGMDMEADLGIDSIKRVEILGAVQDELPDLPELNPDDLAELRTLGQIVDYMNAKAGASTPSVAPVVAAAPVADAPAVDVAKINKVMMDVVADKTGYPPELLDLTMDMEADLGIDSIKRVEILGAVQDELPDLPELNPDDLAELRTLGEIVDYMNSKAGASVSVAVTAPAAAPAAATIDVAKITDVMMSVVAEKTGYPAEMLENNMDMEADLGIDSIKRVEILGAVQDELPDLPELNPDDLAELRTLGQIIDYMKSSSPAGAVASVAPIAQEAQEVAINTVEQVEVATANIEQLKPVMLEVVAEKTGYPAEMLELDMDMEADLGIDSIKRVEILGAVQDAFPELPEINPDVLAELRTLREIIDTMSHTAGFASPKAQQAVETIAPTPKQVEVADQAPSSTVVVKNLNAPDMLEMSIPETAIALITDEGSELTTQVVEGLLAKGWQTVVMRFPSNIVAKQAVLPSGAKVLDLADMTEVALQSALESIAENIGNVDTLIHLQPELLNPTGKIAYPSESKAILQIVFLLAKHLKVSLNDAAETDMRAAFITVPRLDGCLGYGAKNDADLVQGGLFGLTKTVSQEWPGVFCRAVDIAPDLDPDRAANYILSEMNDADTSLAEVGYSDQGRVTLAAVPANSYELAQGQSITSDSVFLVSGGAKGVTTKCAAAVAERYRCKFVLLGRSEFSNTEPEWAQGCSDEAELKKRAMQQLIDSGDKPTPVKIQQFIKPILSNREIAAALECIRQLGAQAEYISADVTDVQGMKAKVQPAIDKLGTITGIIHGAGVLADKFIEQKTVADFDSVYTTKIDGMAAMLSCVDAGSLQHLMLFSSAAGFYGNTGQADYSVANDILNKTALRFKQQQSNCQVVSFNWGPWDGGMVTPELKRMFKERNVYVIPLEAGAQLFVNEMAAIDNRCPQILVGNDMAGGEASKAGGASPVKKPQTSRLLRVIKATSNPFIQDHVIGGNPVVPTVCATGWMASSCETLYPGYTFCGFDNYKLYKGIIFDGSEAETYFMQLTPTSVNDSQLICNAVIGSKNTKGLPRKHYEADIALCSAVVEAPLYQHVDLSDQQVKTGAQLYQNGTLFHGERFQGIDALLNINQQKMTLKCHATEVSTQDQGQFPIGAGNAYTDDLMYQAMLVWARHEYDSGSLPSCAKSFEQYSVIQPGQTFYLSLDVVSHSTSNLTADITLHDESGRIYSLMKSGEVTISKSLGKLFEK